MLSFMTRSRESSGKPKPARLLETLRELFTVLPEGAKRFYGWYATISGILGLFETAALALMLLVITPVVSGSAVSLPLVGEIPENWTIWLVVAMCALFILKGILAVSLHWFATRRFARYELEVGNQLFRGYTRSSWEHRSSLSTAEVTRIVDSSMANTNLGFILPLSQIPVNLVTFVSILAMLLVAQPWVALVAIFYLGIVAFLMTTVLNRQMRLAGRHNREFAYRVATVMTEMVDALKEVTLRGKLDEVGEVVNRSRQRATRARANMSFLGVVPKYAMEAALVGGFLIVGGFSFWMGGVREALLSVALFGVTGFRMIPALNSVQGALATASSNEVYAKDVIKQLRETEISDVQETLEDTAVLPEDPKVLTLRDVRFRYPGAQEDVLKGLSLDIPFGSSLAIVGPSGAGKSTLVDVLLGLSRPASGEMKIDGIPLSSVLGQWRDRVGYVPQRVALFDASVAQNVALTWEDSYDEDRVMSALERAQLSELTQRGTGLREKLGERGAAISGGQQQRMGIARALYSDPLVMVLDEATSSLDTGTEKRVSEAVEALGDEVTFITVAHRLSTVKDYDRICYLDGGEIVASGTFAEVVDQVPEFRYQAGLAGLLDDERGPK